MIVDTSAVLAVLKGEADAEQYVAALTAATSVRLSAATMVEMGIIVDAVRDPVLSRRLDELLNIVGARIERVTEEQARVARQAYRDYGRGSGHPARLNLGHCFSYALASTTGEPLLFEGGGFAATDLTWALTG